MKEKETIEQSDCCRNRMQNDIVAIANYLFDGSKTLSEFESEILNKTFKKSLKNQSTLPGRK